MPLNHNQQSKSQLATTTSMFTDVLDIKIVPTKHHDGPSSHPVSKEIRRSSLDRDGLAAIKKNDPFLYYSIPGVRSESLNKRIELQSPLGMQSSILVQRRSCVSVECDILKLIELNARDELKAKRAQGSMVAPQ